MVATLHFSKIFFLPKIGGRNNPPPQKNLPCILSGGGLFRPLRYNDICYDFDNPKKRDMALKDRIKET